MRLLSTTTGRLRLLHAIAALAGVIGFAVLVDRFGWRALRDAVVDAGGWFVWIALIDLASVCCDAAAVYQFVRGDAPISYGRVFAAQASGLAINRLTPANSMGEAIKVTMLVDHVPRDVAIASIVKFNISTLYVALAVIVLGVPLTLLTLDLPMRVELAVWLGTTVLLVLGAALAVLLRRGAIASLIDAARRIGLLGEPRAARWTRRIAALDDSFRRFGTARARRAVAFVAASRALHSIATVLVLVAAAVPLTAPVVLAMLSIGIVITWMSNVIPLGVGIADGTNYFLYGALGASPTAGLVFTMVNRTRTLVLAGMGLVVMLVANVLDRRQR